MFERFTREAVEVVRRAPGLVTVTGASTVGAPELLLSLLDDTDRVETVPMTRVRTALRLTAQRASIERALAEVRRHGGLSPADTRALADLGIDVETIVARVEEVHGVGALAAASTSRRRALGKRGPARRPVRGPFGAEGKAVLERSLRIALGRRDKHIGEEHLLLALTAPPGVVGAVLADHGITFAGVEAALADD